MRKTTLYTIQEATVLAGDTYSIYEKHFDHNNIIELPEISAALIPIDRIDLPVHHVRKIEYGIHSDKFIALHPKLQEILEAPLVSRYEERVVEAEEALNKRKEWVKAFNTMPWYKRAYKAVRYGII